VAFVLVAPATSIKRNKNEKIEIAVAISHFDKFFMRFSCFNDPGLRQVESQAST